RRGRPQGEGPGRTGVAAAEAVQEQRGDRGERAGAGVGTEPRQAVAVLVQRLEVAALAEALRDVVGDGVERPDGAREFQAVDQQIADARVELEGEVVRVPGRARRDEDQAAE